MSFKTGGFKTKYYSDEGYDFEEHTIYCALESVTDICVYRMCDINGKDENISIGAEVDDRCGKYSLIDCLYHLKRHENKEYDNHDNDIIIEEMTKEEIKRIFS